MELVLTFCFHLSLLCVREMPFDSPHCETKGDSFIRGVGSLGFLLASSAAELFACTNEAQGIC